ncbi:PfkB family carbohydrate kinase [Streptomyces sp. NPDC005381]|uniref:PfkB family carbohydrate kinase n=1 Tax=Streptomyces sp. NPDC005381 TaxID=3364714 RepID=UPI0036C92CCC
MEDILVLGTVGRERVHSFGITSPVVFGGTAFYAAEAILRAGAARPLLVSALGHDLTPAELADQFSGPVNTRGLRRNADLPSFYWEARYDRTFEESTTVALENRLIDGFAPDWFALGDSFPGIRFCYLAAFDPKVQLACATHFAECFVLSETLEYWIGRNRQGVLDLAGISNGFVVTEREFRALWEFDAPPYTPYRRVAGILERCGLDLLIVTFADRGSQVFDTEGTFLVPALSCATVDSTGAGNAFSGGIVAHLAQSGKYQRGRLLDAVALGTVLASLQVRDFSNRALWRASSSAIGALRQKVRSSIRWFDPGV